MSRCHEGNFFLLLKSALVLFCFLALIAKLFFCDISGALTFTKVYICSIRQTQSRGDVQATAVCVAVVNKLVSARQVKTR